MLKKETPLKKQHFFKFKKETKKKRITNGITDYVPTTSDMHALKTSLAGWSDYSRIFITGNQPNKISLIQETANMQLVCMNIKKC